MFTPYSIKHEINLFVLHLTKALKHKQEFEVHTTKNIVITWNQIKHDVKGIKVLGEMILASIKTLKDILAKNNQR